MKKSPLILIVLMLSSFFVMSSYSVAIPAQPNLAKDFALSTDYATHEDSITAFSETSEDDTLLYPDGLLTDAFLATGGDTGFGNTYVVDASYFVTVADSELEFDDVFEGLGMIAGDVLESLPEAILEIMDETTVNELIPDRLKSI